MWRAKTPHCILPRCLPSHTPNPIYTAVLSCRLSYQDPDLSSAAAAALRDGQQTCVPELDGRCRHDGRHCFAGHAQQRIRSVSASKARSQRLQQQQQQEQQGGQEVPAKVRCFAAHYAGDEGLARPFSAAPSDRNLAWGTPPAGLQQLDMQRNAAQHQSFQDQYPSRGGLPSQQAHCEDWGVPDRSPQHEEASHRPAQAWPEVQAEQQRSDVVPSAVQQRAAQYAGDEGLARPPTRPPSDWRPRTNAVESDEAVVPSHEPNQDIARYATVFTPTVIQRSRKVCAGHKVCALTDLYAALQSC